MKKTMTPRRSCRVAPWAGLASLVVAQMFGAAFAMDPVTDVRQLAMSEYFGCAVSDAGTVRCAGNNGQGELGLGSAEPFVPFARVTLPSGVTAVAVGEAHACAIADGSLWCWGSNSHGQVGGGLVGTRVGVNVKRPVQVIASGVTHVAAGGQNTCAVVSGGLKCWGRNDHGQVGNSIPADAVGNPLDIIASGVTAVASAPLHTCAVVRDDLQCWGLLLSGPPVRLERQLTPRTVITGGVSGVAAATHTCAIVRGALLCWGLNSSGQVGVPGGAAVAPVQPTQVIATGVTQVAVSATNTCAVIGGALWCWGDNGSGQLGPPSPPRTQPVMLVERGVTAVGMGLRAVCAVINGQLECSNRAPQQDAPPQDWQALGPVATPFSTPDPVLPRLPSYGVWQGTLGQQEVMVNLKPEGCDSNYYYMRHLWGISLTEKGKQAALWLEGSDPATATWTIEAATDISIEGTWSDSRNQRRLPIRLKKVAPGASIEADCSSPAAQQAEEAFFAPRFARKAPKVEPAQFEGRAYQVLAVPDTDMHTVQIPTASHKVPRLNRRLLAWLRSQVVEYYGCQLNMGRFAPGQSPAPDFTISHEPVFWNAHALVLRETYSSYCGGAHPNGGVSGYITWDLDADKDLAADRWIRQEKTGEREKALPAKLLKLLDRNYARGRPGDDECQESIRMGRSFFMHPQTDGMVFTPDLPHVVQACADDVLLKWSELLPFLTPAGSRAVKDKIQSGRLP